MCFSCRSWSCRLSSSSSLSSSTSWSMCGAEKRPQRAPSLIRSWTAFSYAASRKLCLRSASQKRGGTRHAPESAPQTLAPREAGCLPRQLFVTTKSASASKTRGPVSHSPNCTRLQ
eukprot:Amastigsp_a2781_11.p3 type:complete len:116 gc:universal Amastigsp_a2781_11:557-904(+)